MEEDIKKRPLPTVVFQSDFGFGGGGAMTGVVKNICPQLPTYDLDHHIEPFNIRAAAYSISTVTPFWPSGTVFVSVVDPGVGTSRRSCIAKLANGSYVVTPDNGTLTLIADDIVEIRSIDERINRLPGSENVFIFHGRDVYAYNAGRLAAGVITFEEAGAAYPLEEIVRLPLTNVPPEIRPGYAKGGIYNYEASYGCIRINIPNPAFREKGGFTYGEKVQITIRDGERIPYRGEATYARTFGDVPTGEPILLGDIQPGEKQKLRFTLNDMNFIRLHLPELEGHMDAAVDYIFTVQKL